MEEHTVEILTISELIQRCRPLTGASSLSFTPLSPSNPNPKPRPSDENQNTPSDPTSPKTLKPLNQPTVLIGTLNLPNHSNRPSTTTSNSNSPFLCPKTSCFSFSDGSASICCDILDLHPRILGKKIRILAWNFIPLKSGGGFLEIIKWGFQDSSSARIPCSSNSESFPLIPASLIDKKDNCNAPSFVHGVLESVSPVTIVPCSTGVKSDNGSSLLCGFLSQILVCECKLCSSRDSVKALHDICEGQNGHGFTKYVIVYFCGFASCWHPVISRLVGNFVSLSGLKKKLVFIGKEESQLMYVTTEKALLHIPRLRNQFVSFQKTDIVGKGECSLYSGVVTGIYMQGMVVELDQKVLLLLTDQQLNLTHSLRIGAIVSVRNVHFVNPKFSWTKILILGACIKTSIHVKSFSPMETGCHIHSQSQSLLGKFIDSLPFSARLWVLLVVSCLTKNFSGILSEKDILGSKHKQGLAQKYCSSCLPLSVFRFRLGIFTEYCKHDSCGCGSEPNYGHLKLVLPISSFISHCESTWIKMILEKKTDSDIMDYRNQNSPLKCEGRSYNQPIKRFLKSEDTDVVLLGNLKSFQSSGSLQLVDATGSIDIVTPDLPSTWSIDSIYKIYDFTVVMESISDQADDMESLSSESFSCRSLFNNVPFVRERKLAIFLYCQFSDENSRNRSFCPGLHWKGFEELSGRFHMLRITHKYPVLQKLQGDQVISNRSSIFAEAIILPWDLFLSEKDGDEYVTTSEDHQKDSMEHYAGSHEERAKRCKTIKETTSTLSSGSSDAGSGLCGSSNYCSTTYRKTYGEKICLGSSYPLEIQCFIARRSVNCHCLASSETLFRCKNVNAKVSSCLNPDARKVLLEFELDSFCKFELMRIGGYYIIKHHKEDLYCFTKYSNDVSGSKIVITSRTNLLSFSFSSDEVLPEIGQELTPPINGSFSRIKEVLSEESHQIELPFMKFKNACLQFCTDWHLFLPADSVSFLEVNLKLLEQGFVKPPASFEELANISQRMTESIQFSGTSNSDCLLPEGNLISLHGHVVALHNSDKCSLAAHIGHKSSADGQLLNFFKEVTQRVCIHVLVDHHMVRIFGSLSKHAFPIGLGAGVNATFHRILVLGGQNELMLTPASFIEINSVMVVNDQYEGKRDSPSAALGLHNVASLETGPKSLISETRQCLDNMLLQLHCKVVAVYVLVLEKNREVVHPHPRTYSCPPLVNIPLAGFVLDDGSSSCCCWATNERATTLLKLHEVNLFEAPGRTLRRSKQAWLNNARSSKHDRVDKILQQHGRVVVKNYGSTFDSTFQDLTVSVGADKIISSSDEKFLKFNILNACFSTTFWTVVGSLMDSNATEQLEKRLMQLDMPMLPLQNIWAREVFQPNPVSEARNIIEELLNMKPVS